MKYRYIPLVCLSLPALAQSSELLREEMLVTGSYSPRPAITSSVSVLDAVQIAALNKRSVADLLKTLPGLLVEEQGGPGGLSAVSIRGGEANFTVVLIDGVAVNDPTNSRGGSFDFSNLNSALVERIEVVRGAQSAIYGSDALAGVINIITRRPAQGHRQSLRTEVGEDDFYNVGLTALGREGDFDYTIELATRDDGDGEPGSERESDSVALRVGWQPDESHAVSASYRYLDGERSSYPEQSGGPRFAANDDLDHGDYQDQVFALGWEYQIREQWRQVLSLTRFEHEEGFSSPGIDPYSEVPPNVSDTDFTRDQLQWVNTLALGERLELDLGADYRLEEGESTGYLDFGVAQLPTDFDLDRDSYGFFANLSASPTADLLLNGSVRHDEPEDFDAETSWQAGLLYSASEALTFAFNWGEAFKLPSFFALGHGLVGNPDLEPEQSESWDAGITWQPVDSIETTLTWFFNDYTDLIDFDSDTFQNVNRSNVETSGVELASTWMLGKALSLRFSGTYTDIDVKDEETVLTGRPEWTAGVVATWRIDSAWDTALDYRYSGEQWSASRHTGMEVTEELDSFHRVDWVLAWAPSRRWQLRLSVDNLLDERYETAVGFTAPERALRFGITFNQP